MATDETHRFVPAGVDPDASPFEAQPVEGLPLTDDERAEISEAIEQWDRERTAGTSE